jgi:hypothetical protein
LFDKRFRDSFAAGDFDANNRNRDDQYCGPTQHGLIIFMLRQLARKFKGSAFSAILAYVLLLNVLLAGFAQAAMVDHAINGTAVMCTVITPVDDHAAAPDRALIRQCQMCCLAGQNSVAMPPVVTALLARLGVVSAKLFPLKIAGAVFTNTHFVEARGPPLS